jgi:hypothetical protein
MICTLNALSELSISSHKSLQVIYTAHSADGLAPRVFIYTCIRTDSAAGCSARGMCSILFYCMCLQSSATALPKQLARAVQWTCYSESEDGGYCKFCVLFARCEASVKELGVLVTRPLTNFKKATDKLTFLPRGESFIWRLLRGPRHFVQ